jgi:hypothetical protein
MTSKERVKTGYSEARGLVEGKPGLEAACTAG